MLAGILQKVELNDVDKLKKSGYYFSISDIIDLAKNMEPEEYRKIIDSEKPEELFKYDKSKDETNGKAFKENFIKLKNKGINISKEELINNYKLYEKILQNDKIDLFNVPGIEQYNIKQIYPAYTRMLEAIERLKTLKNYNLTLSGKDVLNYIQFSQQVEYMDLKKEEERDSIIGFLILNGDWKKHPALMNYVTKNNSVYKVQLPKDILNYNNFCIEKILSDSNIDLEKAKSNLINSFFEIDVPKENRKDFEKNLIDELYFYQKYKREEKIPKNIDGFEIDNAIDNLINIIDCATIEDFKKKLNEFKSTFCYIQFDTISRNVNHYMKEYAKSDIINELKNTESQIDNMQEQYIIDKNGNYIPVKYLNGQDYTLSLTTVMARCSSVYDMYKEDKDLLEEHILNYQLNRENRCTSLVNQDMCAHAASANSEVELMYGYVPESKNDLGIMGVYDLSTRKQNINGNETRVTAKPTQNRSAKDMIEGTQEEHNELVLNGYPRFIICYDYVSDIAIKKYEQLKEIYNQNFPDKKIEIVLINNKNNYKIQSESNLQSDIEKINEEIENKQNLSNETLEKFFNKRERNITLRTFQSIVSTGYRYDVWNENADKLNDPNNISENKQNFDLLAELLSKVAKVMPEEYLGHLDSQVDFILSQKEKNFYDHFIDKNIQFDKFKEIKEYINSRLFQNSGTISQQQDKDYGLGFDV